MSSVSPVRAAAGRRKQAFWSRCKRAMRLRLVIPMIRSRQPPEQTARAVAVGLFWAMTPTFGIQMALSCVHWYISRTFFKKDFNVVVAMAWTWVTNLFTVPPAYYTFFVTGQVVLGRWDDISGYGSFTRFWETAMGASGGNPFSAEAWQTYGSVILEGWGLALLTGSIPYAIIGYALGYSWTLRLVVRWRAARQQRRAAMAAARRAQTSAG